MSQALYEAVMSGRVKVQDLNESGKAALKSYLSAKRASEGKMDVGFDPEVSDPSLQAKAQDYVPGLNTAFMAKHPTFEKAATKVSAPLRKLFSNPWMERSGQSGAEIMTGTDNLKKVTTGSKVGDLTADLWGGVMGFGANPAGGIQNAGAGLWSVSERAAQAGMRKIPQLGKLSPILQQGLKVGAASVPYEAGIAALNNRPMKPSEMGISAASNFAFEMLPYGIGKAAAKANKINPITRTKGYFDRQLADIFPEGRTFLPRNPDVSPAVHLKPADLVRNMDTKIPAYINPEVYKAVRRPKYVNPEVWQAMNMPGSAEKFKQPVMQRVKQPAPAVQPEVKAPTVKPPALPKVKQIKPRKAKVEIPISERTYESVGSQKVNAYQYDHPEVKPYIQSEAELLLRELKDGVKGEKYYSRDQEGNLVITGAKRFSGDSISRILDNTRATYADIEDALQRIIKDEGAENQALAKRIELILDDNLTRGYKTLDGMDIPPNQEYVSIRSGLGNKADLPQGQSDLTDEDIADLIGYETGSFSQGQIDKGFKGRPEPPSDEAVLAVRARMQAEKATISSKTLHQSVRENGGFTYDAAHDKMVKEGIAVSPYPEHEVILSFNDFTPEHIDRYRAEKAEILKKPGHNVGVWYNEKDGNVYMDITIVTPDRIEAVALGHRHNQLSVFDLGKGEEIHVQTEAQRAARATKANAPDRLNSGGRDTGAGKRILPGDLQETPATRQVTNQISTATEIPGKPAGDFPFNKYKKGNLTREGSISAAKFTLPEKNAPVGDGTKVRSLHVSAMDSPVNHPDTKAGLLMETYPEGAGTYEAITNKETILKAQEMISLDENGALRHARENPGTALSNTIELEALKKANNEGRYDDAVDIVNEVSKRSTTQGQAIQALRLWGNMTAEAMQKHYVRVVESVNREVEKIGRRAKKVVVDPNIMADIHARMNMIKTMEEGRAKDIEIAKVLDIIASQVPVPFLRKVEAIQTMAQLLNPKTAIRNTVGNVGFAAMENISGVVGAGIDAAMGAVTGKRTKVMPSLQTQLKGFKQGWKHGLEDALLGIDTSGMVTKFDLPRGRVFRKGVLGEAEKLLSVELRATDRAFYQGAYEESLRSQMLAAGLDRPTEEMKNIAHLDGLYKTFQDENHLTKLFTKLKNGLNLGFEHGLGSYVIKYPRTPANLLARGIDYSPAGFMKVIFEAGKPAFKHDFDQKKFVEAFSRALVGTTALFGTGALLQRAGVLTGAPVEDRDLAELNRQQGFGEYRINVTALKRLLMGDPATKPQTGDTIISYDWFQPNAISIAVGADIEANKGSGKGLVGSLLNAFATGVNAFAEQPVVQGIDTLFSGQDGAFSDGLIKVLQGVPASYVPTLLNQVRQLVDNQKRETYDPTMKYALNKAQAKIPFLASKLPAKHGTLGQPLEDYQDGGNNILNVLFNPAFKNTYNPSPEVQKATNILEQIGATKQIPRKADKSITVSGKKFVLTGPEYAEYQRLLGTYTQEGFAEIKDSQKPETAADRMQAIITDANTRAKMEILKARGEKVYKKGGGLAIK